MSDKLTISTELMNTIFQYLGTKPYQEVFQMIQGIQTEAGPQMPKEDTASSTASNVSTLTPKK